ncbi:hypothetical protein BRYFOR_06807 [Marvinbryantia formatexigens DSM 14469]|uniref:Uncharacterized protein n=1 Tax=Marvinbryantia formatexigens DSM 14469 TaxID=478749 RepID=C6LDV8_9FIRM|nr:hypothetical protein BRYFOR_06807 [Marvinbryantia formatexigens DSM 14469]SDF68345.1 MatE protein [Marvinbryantia formatexigens]
MMSRALGRKDYDTVYRNSAFGFYLALLCGILFSVIYTAFSGPVLNLLGTSSDTSAATAGYLRWTVTCGAVPAILNVVMVPFKLCRLYLLLCFTVCKTEKHLCLHSSVDAGLSERYCDRRVRRGTENAGVCHPS